MAVSQDLKSRVQALMRLGVRRVRTHWRPRALLVGAGCQTVDAALAPVADQFARHAGAAFELSVSSRWVQAQAVSPQLSAAEGWQQALSNWTSVLELDEARLADDWVVRQARTPRLQVVTAMPRALVDGVVALAREHHVRIDRMGPWWGPALDQWLVQGQDDATAAQQAFDDGDWVTHARRETGDAGVAGVAAVAAVAGSGGLMALWSEPRAMAGGRA